MPRAGDDDDAPIAAGLFLVRGPRCWWWWWLRRTPGHPGVRATDTREAMLQRCVTGGRRGGSGGPTVRSDSILHFDF